MEIDPKAAHPRAGSRTISISDNRIESDQLFAGTREVTITHGQEIYRLRLTGSNKLILTK